MGYIYKITNDINNKVYIGKTTKGIKQRWKEHRKEYTRKTEKHRPLYRAMNKYGLSHFKIESLEKASDIKLSEREIFYIKKYDTYHNGYNATKGGDGALLHFTTKREENKLIRLYNNDYNCVQMSKVFNCSTECISCKLKSLGYKIKKHKNKDSITILQYDLNGKYLRYFKSLKKVGKFLNNTYCRRHVKECCDGTRKTAYGYIWQYGKTFSIANNNRRG